MDEGAWWAAVHGVAKSRTWLSDFTFTFHFHALEKEMATHSSVLAWRIPWTEKPGGLPSMGSHRVRHYWSHLAATYESNIILKSLITILKAFLFFILFYIFWSYIFSPEVFMLMNLLIVEAGGWVHRSSLPHSVHFWIIVNFFIMKREPHSVLYH